jgi:hypothetical protein
LEQRLFLSALSRQFQDLVQAALNVQYYSHGAFEENRALALVAHVVNLTEQFNSDFEEKAQLRYFEPTNDMEGNNGDGEDEGEDEGHDEIEEDTWTSMNAKENRIDDIGIEDPVLENIITKDYDFDYP